MDNFRKEKLIGTKPEFLAIIRIPQEILSRELVNNIVCVHDIWVNE